MGSFNGIKYYIVDRGKGTISTETNIKDKSIILNYPCEKTYDCTPYSVTFPPGTYKIELWGAQGGDARYWNIKTIRPNSGGKGAYTSGILRLEGVNKFYFYIGGKGENQEDYYGKSISKGGYNGGGSGGVDLCDDKMPESSAGGGGSTDIRLILNDSLKALKSRIMVAAAGGGSTSVNNTYEMDTYLSGNGGNLLGNSYVSNQIPGTQTSGLFGKGQNGFDYNCSHFKSGGSTGGSGSGYYGGLTKSGEEYTLADYEIPGAGGSSYISGYDECNSVIEDESNPPKHTGKSIHYSNIFFNEPEMKMFGSNNFQDPYGKYEKGHSGNGAAKITVIETHGQIMPKCTNNIRLIKAPNLFVTQ